MKSKEHSAADRTPAPAATTRDDLALLHAWRDGDRAAGNELLDRHFESLYRYFANRVDRDVDDLIQRVFLETIEARDRFRGESSFRTFLFGVARLELLQFFRRRGRDARRKSVDFRPMYAFGGESSPTTDIAQREEESVLLRSLRSIPVDLQIIVQMVYWEDASMSAISEVFGIPLGTAKSRVRRARKVLQMAMLREQRNASGLTDTFEGFDAWVGSTRASFRQQAYVSEGKATDSVCASLDKVSKKQPTLAGADRAGFVFDSCELGRFSTVVTREEFVGVRANTGAVALIGLGVLLQDTGVPQQTSDTLVRELVLASGVQPSLSPDLKLPAAAGGEKLVPGFLVTLSASGIVANGMKVPHPDILFDIASEWTQKSGETSDAPTYLFVDREVTWAEVKPILASLKRAKSQAPRFVVLENSDGNPLRSVPLPKKVNAKDSAPVQDVVAAW